MNYNDAVNWLKAHDGYYETPELSDGYRVRVAIGSVGAEAIAKSESEIPTALVAAVKELRRKLGTFAD